MFLCMTARLLLTNEIINMHRVLKRFEEIIFIAERMQTKDLRTDLWMKLN